jgi:peptide/nickel transport system substrate-binding protein
MKPKSKIASFFYALFVDLRHLKFIGKIEEVVKNMKNPEKIVFYIVSFIFVVSGLTLLFQLNSSLMVEVPAYGGSFTEGLIGSPRFVNPVLAISDTDKDLVSLVYSGLLKVSKDGGFEPDLASSYEVSSNGTVYDFKIKDNAYFHDGKAVTVDDIIFTINKVLDPVIKSPKKANWDGVLVEKVSDKEVKFTLGKPYTPFLSALTLGILPKHIWENVTSEEFPFSQFNINPVGSGPYKVEKISRNSGGIPTTITFSSWEKYTLGRSKIQSITFKFFQNETDLMKAYGDKSVDNVAGLSPTSANKIGTNGNLVNNISLPRVFGVFLNQNVAPIFLNKEIREALDQATPKKRIVDEVLYGFGRVLDGPTPSYVEEDSQAAGDIEAAKASLLKAGWKANTDGILQKKTKKETILFSFSITTSDAPELKQTAEILKEAWEKLGASVSIKVFEAGDLSQNVIKGRKYDALLFGEVVEDDSDLYPFWHSSARNDPGLNISLYANITVDKALEDMQKETSAQMKAQNEEIVASEIKKDTPAIFLFSPDLLYATTPKIKNATFKSVSSLNERFLYINDWYIETDKVWKIFVKS